MFVLLILLIVIQEFKMFLENLFPRHLLFWIKTTTLPTFPYVNIFYLRKRYRSRECSTTAHEIHSNLRINLSRQHFAGTAVEMLLKIHLAFLLIAEAAVVAAFFNSFQFRNSFPRYLKIMNLTLLFSTKL